MMYENHDDLTVSVVIPTFNRCDWLKRLLLSLEHARGADGRLEVVVTIDGGTDGTPEMLAALRTGYPLRVLTQPNSGPAAARNRALAAASGDVLLFLDDDVVPMEGLIDRHLEVHRQDPSAVAIGRILPPPRSKLTPWARWEAGTFEKHYDALRAGRHRVMPHHFFTGNASMRREHALAAGGFDEGFRRGEDVEFAYRLAGRGLRFHFVPAAAVLHEADHTFRDWLRISYKYGRQDVVMARDHGRMEVLHVVLGRWRGLNPLTRIVARRCVGHPRQLRAVVGVLERMITYEERGAPARVQAALCGGLANVQYWQGFADESGLGPRVWRVLDDQSVLAPGAKAVVGTRSPVSQAATTR